MCAKTRNSIIIDNQDNVVVAIHALNKGDCAIFELPDGQVSRIKLIQDIPTFHKIARYDIRKNEKIVKYGEYIGVASADIKAGEHIHTHNCESNDEAKKKSSNGNIVNVIKQEKIKTNCDRSFYGYKREDGQIGIRNHVLILPTSICASDVCERIARSVDGCVSFHNQNGCSQVNIDNQLTIDTIAGLAANPNIHSVLAVSLGCENCQNDIVIDAIKKRTNKEIRSLIIQKVGGSVKAIDKGIKIAKELVAEADKSKRQEFGVDKLILGTNCGGSDLSSGLGSNPLIGEVSDWFVDQGATTVLCETPEIYGGEYILARRAINQKVGDDVIRIVRDYEDYVAKFGVEMREGNPSPGNLAGGITTLEEKSLGCIHKSGHRPISNVYQYAEKIKSGEGLVVMDTPGNDASSVGGIIAGGCQLVVFSTGLGTPTGNAIAPVFRITANPNTAKTMADNTDMDVSETIYGPRTMTELCDDLISRLIDVCNGKTTCAEEYNFIETALPHLCNYM